MAYILNIETSTKNCSVSVAHNGLTLISKEISDQGYSHAEKLHLFIQEICNQAQLSLSDLNAVAVSMGPGSYTGLRIGVSAAKGFCFALDLPLIALDTLTILANQLENPKGLIIPMIDARRMEVYAAVFDQNKQMIRPVAAEILTEDSFADYSETINFIGDSSEKAKTVLTQDRFLFHDAIVFPSANQMSALSFEKYKSNDFVDVAYFEPYYLKDFMMTTKK
ncbi:tRNA (adenosine(37)-N6)-threonylcarbamoyltransferase complex dimerization subunit type 1 TsaB [Flavobacterium sp. SUN046]|uniref:tRNA (adenosine(37)-N6)-threonylcarbamoyltransferase complex dimerization subunit type 1 TsaB n=1 Tax=Flavobacterium sp. SUN046 TaxID=3002440 RepID=UPI002DB9C682|nr:tRNA (adenosine(37)-N6)-threonylcarbamoyltransferase complex dimerization subunit type 1 TsaB [Flavobacterium sp. SUN046]MEC4047835.1 tRNA (adenosine(37)-N6)-threonylcarbamoyltransferase complex dimerization subunit type 1 TsaB [Flavobacterium sp. SUN046]